MRRISTAACLLLCLASRSEAQSTVRADAFVDSVGVNVHLHYNDTLYYDNFSLTRSRLQELRVRHVRDGLIETTWTEYYDRHNTLGRSGIKGTFIAALNATAAELQEYPSRMSDTFEAFEGPNEPNDSGDPLWVDKTRTVLERLRSVQGRFPVYGPSLTAEWAYQALGDISAWVNFGNMHNYFAGRHPGTGGWGAGGYGSINWNLKLVNGGSGGKPAVTTETGYRNDFSAPDAVPSDIAARYMPRLLLEQFRAGIARTFLYELVDSGPEQYGLLLPNGDQKPAFTAVKSLLSLLDDPGPAVVLSPLDYGLQNEPSDLRHLAFQKRDGTYYLALWLERSSYDVDGRSSLPAIAAPVTVTVPSSQRLVSVVQWQADGTTKRVPLGHTQSGTVTVSDDLSMVEVAPAAPRPPTQLKVD
jgi:hypothetical protein